MKDIDWGYLFGMALQTVPEPRKVARDLFAFPASRHTQWLILALILVSMTILAVLSTLIYRIDPEQAGAVYANPAAMGILQAVSAVAMIHAIYWIGRAVGGTGSFEQAQMTVIWLHFVLLMFQLGIFVLGLFAAGLVLILTVMSFVMSFWLLSHFIAEMHGFRSAGTVFVGILLVLLVLAVALSLVFAVLGIGVAVETGPGGM